jgi:hypothetical protein
MNGLLCRIATHTNPFGLSRKREKFSCRARSLPHHRVTPSPCHPVTSSPLPQDNLTAPQSTNILGLRAVTSGRSMVFVTETSSEEVCR